MRYLTFVVVLYNANEAQGTYNSSIMLCKSITNHIINEDIDK